MILLLQPLLTLLFAYLVHASPIELVWSFWAGACVAGLTYIAFGFGFAVARAKTDSEEKVVRLAVASVVGLMSSIYLFILAVAQAVLALILFSIVGLPSWKSVLAYALVMLPLAAIREYRSSEPMTFRSLDDVWPLLRSTGPFLFALFGIAMLRQMNHSSFEAYAFVLAAFFPYVELFEYARERH